MITENQKKILQKLEQKYGSPGTELNYNTPLELLIATILSAQCTDVRVNKTTEILFKKYKNVYEYANAIVDELSQIIKPCGLYKNKTKFIINSCKSIIENFAGEVPKTRNELQTLPGVGRKTANVVIANAFNQDAIAVDTHVFRVSKRLGLASSEQVLKVEQELMQVIPKQKWSDAHHWLIYHGRETCKARKPLCKECLLVELCPYTDKQI